MVISPSVYLPQSSLVLPLKTTTLPLEKAEQDVRTRPMFATGRPMGDNRSAEQIIEDNPILKNLGHQRDINRHLAYARLGDWTANNPDPIARANAAFNAAWVLNYIDTSLSASGEDRAQASGNGDLEGITSSGDARHGTPAGMWKNFTEQGYSVLRADHRLDSTSDTHVRPDGSNKDNLQWGAGEVGRGLWFIPMLSNVLVGIEKSESDFGSVIAGAKAGMDKTMNDGLGQALTGVVSGDLGAVVQGVTDMFRKSEATPEAVKAALDASRNFSD